MVPYNPSHSFLGMGLIYLMVKVLEQLRTLVLFSFLLCLTSYLWRMVSILMEMGEPNIAEKESLGSGRLSRVAGQKRAHGLRFSYISPLGCIFLSASNRIYF